MDRFGKQMASDSDQGRTMKGTKGTWGWRAADELTVSIGLTQKQVLISISQYQFIHARLCLTQTGTLL